MDIKTLRAMERYKNSMLGPHVSKEYKSDAVQILGLIECLAKRVSKLEKERDNLLNCYNCISFKLNHCSQDDVTYNGNFCPNWSYSLKEKSNDKLSRPGG